MMINSAKPRCVPWIETHATGTDLLVHDTRRGKVHVLNATAGTVLSLCDGDHSVDAIVEALAEAGSVEKNIVGPDVARVLEAFRELALLEPVDGREEG
jgi:hypothetical protein